MQTFIQNQSWPLLLKASWQGAVLIVLVLAVQWALGRRLSPRWRFGLWLLVVLRLTLPWTIPSAVSLFNVVNFSSAPEAVVNLWATGATVLPLANSAPPDRTLTAAAPKWNISLSWWPLAWAAGALAMTLGLGAAHYRLMRRVTSCRPLIDDRILRLLADCKQRMGVRAPVALVETTAVDGPCLFGFLQPRLLLPPSFTRDFSLDELRFVFLHELGHVKRHDILLGWLMAWLQILHWFNPLVWLAFSRMRMERELACDAMALSHTREDDHKPYGRTMVKLLEHFGDSPHTPSLAGIVEDKQQMKERILMIAQFQKSNRGFAVAASLFVALGLLTLTDAQLGCKSSAPATEVKTPLFDRQNQLSPPRIVSTSPAVGVSNVDPALNEITVTFDQDMGRGYSWTGGGSDYPPTPEDAKVLWRDQRTCVLPVKLEAGHYYRVGINSTSFQNFASVQGVAALPSAIFFSTQGASEVLKAKTLAPQAVRFEPANGARNVSASVAELRVTFSVPMGGGCSWCATSDDGVDFPNGREGKSYYWTTDKKTCVLPVELKPGMTYRLSLNAPSFQNFQSEAGVPLEPVAYTFKTEAGSRWEKQTD